MVRTWWTVCMFTMIALSGCADTDESSGSDTEIPTDDEAVLSGDGRDLRTDLLINDTLQQPNWNVGHWFGHHIFYGADDNEGTHINTVVVEDRGTDWFLAADDEQAAKWEGAWDFPMLGEVDKTTLETTAFGAQWKIYDFPLSHGKTWSSQIDPLFNGVRDIDFTATYNAKISTPYGDRPGFDVLGLNETGETEIITNFVPDIGWYSKLTLLDLSTEEEDDYVIHVNSMGFGNNWTGEFILAEAEQKLSTGTFATPFAPQASSPGNAGSFSLAGETELYGIVYAGATSGTSHFALTDPSGNRDEFRVTHASASGASQLFDFIEETSERGEYRFDHANAGQFSWSGARLWEITYETVLLE